MKQDGSVQFRGGNAFLLGLLLMGGLSSAQAAINSVSFSVLSDGTANFDPAPGPGYDTGANNRIVRTNDTFAYRVSFSTTGTENNLTVVSTLPKGAAGQSIARWTSVPAYCLTGSGISADGQTITCVYGSIGPGSTTNIDLTAIVLGTTANGTTIAAPTLTMTSSSGTAPAPTTPPASLTVSAAPFYDIVVQNSFQGNPKAYGYAAGGGPNNANGFYERPLIGLVGRNPNGFGNKGVEQLSGPVSITVDLSGMPAGTVLDNYHNGNPVDGTPAATGSFVDGCGNPSTGQPSTESGGNINLYNLVGDTGAPSTVSSIVPNGGDCAVASVSGSSVTLNIAGMDTSMTRRPTTYLGTGAAIPATDWWVFNKAMVLWTPITSYPTNVPVTHTIKLGSFSGTSISGQALQNVLPGNDAFNYSVTNNTSGSATKAFSPDNSLPAPYATVADPTFVGDTLTNYMTPGQTVRSRVIVQNLGTTDFTNASACEIIDRTVFDIGSNLTASVAGGTPTPTFSYGARPAGSSMYFSSTDSANASDLQKLNVAGGTSAYSAARCDDPGIRWFSTAAEAEAAGGLVYVRANYAAIPAGTSAVMYVSGLILRSTYAATISTTYPTTVTHTAGDPITDGTLIRNVADFWNTGVAGIDNPGTNQNDHLQVVTMKTTSRVTKSVLTVDGRAVNASSTTSPAPVPAVLPGSVITYALQPRYSTAFPPQSRTFTVTDILPPGLSYVPGSATVGGAASEPQIFANDPAPGYTRLVWTYLNRKAYVGSDSAAANLPEIRFNAAVAVGASNGTVLTNATAVSGGGATAGSTDDYSADCTYSTATFYGSCVKSAQMAVQVQTTPGFRIQKNTPKTTIEPGGAFSFTVSYASFGQDMGTSDIPDMIDILPYVGDGSGNTALNFTGRNPASAFAAGAYTLTSVTPPSNDPSMQVYYTAAAPNTINQDARDASNNLATGTTRWCLITNFGTAGCPTDLTQVTAVRLHPGVAMMPADTLYTATLNFTSTATARPGNVFNNSVGAHSVDPASSLKFVENQAQSAVRVVTGSLSGQVFVDVNQNGSLESGSDTALANTCITLTGTVPAGTVTYSTRSRADGTYSFANGAANIFPTADCTGTAIGSFGGLVAGTYTLTQTQPAGYRDGADFAGTLGGTVGSDQISSISLTVGQNGTGYNFTELPLPLTLGKTVQPSVYNVNVDSRDPSGTTLTYSPATQQLVYALEVANPGSVAVNNVFLKDVLPSGVTFVSATMDGVKLTPTSTAPLTLTLPTLAANTTKTVLLTVQVAAVAPNTPQTTIRNTASVSAAGVPAVTSPEARTEYVYTRSFKQVHNLGTQPGATVPQPSPAWTDSSSASPGDTLEYCIDFYNYGTLPLTSYRISDNIPAYSTVIPDSWVLKQGTMQSVGADFSVPSSVSLSGNTLVAVVDTLDPQAGGTLCFRTRVNGSTP